MFTRKIGWLLVLFALLLSACGLGAQQEPTPDTVAIRTQAVETAVSEMTLQALLNPTATLVPTNTLLPTATSSEATTTPKPVSGGGSGSSSGTVSTRAPTAVVLQTWATKKDWCQLVSEDPLDHAQPAGWNYDKVWNLRNIGTNTWTLGVYKVVWRDDVANNQNWSYGATSYELPHDVKPKETVKILIDVQVPSGVTDQLRTTFWGIANDKGEVFCKFYHTIPSTY